MSLLHEVRIPSLSCTSILFHCSFISLSMQSNAGLGYCLSNSLGVCTRFLSCKRVNDRSENAKENKKKHKQSAIACDVVMQTQHHLDNDAYDIRYPYDGGLCAILRKGDLIGMAVCDSQGSPTGLDSDQTGAAASRFSFAASCVGFADSCFGSRSYCSCFSFFPDHLRHFEPRFLPCALSQMQLRCCFAG